MRELPCSWCCGRYEKRRDRGSIRSWWCQSNPRPFAISLLSIKLLKCVCVFSLNGRVLANALGPQVSHWLQTKTCNFSILTVWFPHHTHTPTEAMRHTPEPIHLVLLISPSSWMERNRKTQMLPVNIGISEIFWNTNASNIFLKLRCLFNSYSVLHELFNCPWQRGSCVLKT